MVEDQPTPNDAAVPQGPASPQAPAPTPLPGVGGPPPVPAFAPTIGGGRYALASKIAEGGMAGVYRAWDHKMRVWRAIKVLLPEYTRKDILRDRFEGEAKTMARLDHPNVVRVYDVGTREALPYMVMELAEGGTVNGWLDAYGRMPPRLAVSVVIEVARGLAAAHALGVVHRDVKPHNVLVTADGLCKLTDFGIAHGAMDTEGRTNTNATMGTIGYMAPEQRADARLVDVRADIYSLGAMLYKLVVGKVMTDLFLVEHEPKLLEPVPELLHEVVVRACFHDRERRYPSTQVMMAALTEIRALLPPDPPDTPPLAVPLREVTPGRDGPIEFPEIGVLLGTSTPKPAPPVLPYTMPKTAAVRRSLPPPPRRDEEKTYDSELPSYVEPVAPARATTPKGAGTAAARTSAGPARPLADRPDRGLDRTGLDRTGLDRAGLDRAGTVREEVVVGAPERSTVTPVRKRGEPMWPPFVTGLAMATVALWGIVIVLTGAWTVEIRNQARATREARVHLLEVIDQERSVIPELALRGSPPSHVATLTELYGALAVSPEGWARAHAIRAYIAGITVESEVILGNTGATDLTAVRVRNIKQAWAGEQRARARWANATWWPQGWLATRLGLAPRPPRI